MPDHHLLNLLFSHIGRENYPPAALNWVLTVSHTHIHTSIYDIYTGPTQPHQQNLKVDLLLKINQIYKIKVQLCMFNLLNQSQCYWGPPLVVEAWWFELFLVLWPVCVGLLIVGPLCRSFILLLCSLLVVRLPSAYMGYLWGSP